MIAANTHVGEHSSHFQMKQYLTGRNREGHYIINIEKTWEKLVLAARAICAIENSQDVAIVGTHSHTSRAVLKCARYLNAFAFAGRFTPGTFTNQIQRAFREPRLLICHDPKNDHQAINEASYVNIPVIAFCDADSSTRLVDVVIPCNTRFPHSIGLMFWLLTREVLRMRGKISRDIPWEVMVDLFFYRSPEEQEQEEQAQAGSVGTTGAAGMLATLTSGAGGGMSSTTPGMIGAADTQNWEDQGWEADPVAPSHSLAPGARAVPAAVGAPVGGMVAAGQQPVLQPTADWSAVGVDDWGNADHWQ